MYLNRERFVGGGNRAKSCTRLADLANEVAYLRNCAKSCAADANTRLIVYAPEMLELLKQAVVAEKKPYDECVEELIDIAKSAKDVINKIEGK